MQYVWMVGVLGPGVGAQSGPRSLAQCFVLAGHCVEEGSGTSRGLDFLTQPGHVSLWSRPYKWLPCIVPLTCSQPGQIGPTVGPEPKKAFREVAGHESSEYLQEQLPHTI